MSNLVLFPWLYILEVITIDNYKLIPFIRGERLEGKQKQIQKSIDIILESYVEKNGNPIRNSTIVNLVDRGIFDNLDEE